MTDERANFEVVTDLLWITEQYVRFENNLPHAPDFADKEQCRVALNAAIKSVFDRIPSDGYCGYLEIDKE